MFDNYVMIIYVDDPVINSEFPIGVKISSLNDFYFFATDVMNRNVEIISCDLYKKINIWGSLL